MNKKNLLTKIKELASDVMNLEKEPIITKEDIKDAPIVVLAQETTDDGAVLEAESFEAGQGIFIVNEDERVPLPVGEYAWDGKVIVVAEEGIIGEITEAVAEPEANPEAEVEAEVEYVTVQQFNEAIEQIKSMFSKQEAEELSKEKEKVVELQKQIDETPDAEPTKHKPKVELKEMPATTKKGRITQLINSKK